MDVANLEEIKNRIERAPKPTPEEIAAVEELLQSQVDQYMDQHFKKGNKHKCHTNTHSLTQ